MAATPGQGKYGKVKCDHYGQEVSGEQVPPALEMERKT